MAESEKCYKFKKKCAGSAGGGGLPEATEADNGKVLMVVDGAWQAAAMATYKGEYEVIE